MVELEFTIGTGAAVVDLAVYQGDEPVAAEELVDPGAPVKVVEAGAASRTSSPPRPHSTSLPDPPER